jgi:hypothetical protein
LISSPVGVVMSLAFRLEASFATQEERAVRGILRAKASGGPRRHARTSPQAAWSRKEIYLGVVRKNELHLVRGELRFRKGKEHETSIHRDHGWFNFRIGF